MSVHNKLEPIYNLIINSSEDLENVLYHSNQDNEKISQILKFRGFDTFDQISNHLDLSYLFKDAYRGSLCFNASIDLVRDINCYQQLLNRSINVCNDILTPLLIRSFKCHRTALGAFKTEKSKESSVNKMAETGEIAKQIAKEYKNLAEELLQLRENVVKTMCTLASDRSQLYQLATKSSDATHLKILTKGITSLDKTIELPFWELQAALLNMHMTWTVAERHCQCLADPFLADQSIVEALADESLDSSDFENKFWDGLRQVEKEINIVMPNPQPVENLEDVTKSMKSGITTISEAPENSLVELLRVWTPTIEGEFEQSYLKWLALAKVNLEITNAMKNTIVEIDEIQADILQTEKDPLVIALHEAASNA